MKFTLALITILFLCTGIASAAENPAPVVPTPETHATSEAPTVQELEQLDESLEALEGQIFLSHGDCIHPSGCASVDDFCTCVFAGNGRGYCSRAYC